jgi:hypothetical protein
MNYLPLSDAGTVGPNPLLQSTSTFSQQGWCFSYDKKGSYSCMGKHLTPMMVVVM